MPVRIAVLFLALALTFGGAAAAVSLLVVREGWCTFARCPSLVPVLESCIGPICHHQLTRTIGVRSGFYLPVCARCTGLYLGWLAGTVLGAVVGAQAGASRRKLRGVVLLVSAMFATCVVEAVAERLGVVTTTNVQRLSFGLGLGLFPATVLAVGSVLLWSEAWRVLRQRYPGEVR